MCGASTSARFQASITALFNQHGRARSVSERWSTRTPPRSPRSWARSAPSSCSSHAAASPRSPASRCSGSRPQVSARSLVGDDDVELLLTEPAGLALVGTGVAAAVARRDPAGPLPGGRSRRLPRRGAVPNARSGSARRTRSSSCRSTSSSPRRSSRSPTASCEESGRPRPPSCSRSRSPRSSPSRRSRSSGRGTSATEGSRSLSSSSPSSPASGSSARSPLAAWLPRALLVTLVALGSLFAAIGIWQAQTRTVFFARDVEVANAYTSFFRVTSLFKDPSLYGRYLVVPIAVLLVVVLVRKGRTVDWVVAAALVAFLFWGLFYSYSQSSFVALFVVTFAVALCGVGPTAPNPPPRLRSRRRRRGAAAVAAQAIEGRSARRRRAGARASSRHARRVRGAADRRRRRRRAAARERRARGQAAPGRNASHTTPLTVLAELGVVGFALYAWVLAAAALGARPRDADAIARSGSALAAVLLALFVHSLLYAGFFEDPLTWGVLGVAAAFLAARRPRDARAPRRTPRRALRSCWHTDSGPARPALASCPEPSPGSSPRSPCSWPLSAASRSRSALMTPNQTEGALDTELTDVTVTDGRPSPQPSRAGARASRRRRCWPTFGGDPQRSLARPDATLGLPARRLLWTRGSRATSSTRRATARGRSTSTPSRARSSRSTRETGKIRWRRDFGGTKPSTPAIDGPRIIVSSRDGTVTALDRERGRQLWQVQTSGKVESSPVVVDGLAYFGVDRRTPVRRRLGDRPRPLGVRRRGAGSTRARPSTAAASASRRTRARSSA